MSVWTQQQAVLSQHRVYPVPPLVLQGITLFGWWKDGIKCDAG